MMDSKKLEYYNQMNWPALPYERVRIPGIDIIKCHSTKWVAVRDGEVLGFVYRTGGLEFSYFRMLPGQTYMVNGQHCIGPYPSRQTAFEAMLRDGYIEIGLNSTITTLARPL